MTNIIQEPIQVRCPQCSEIYEITTDMLGRKLLCEVCNKKNKLVTTSTLQDLLLLKFNIYKSWKGHEDGRYKVLKQIYRLDPQTHQGIGAKGYLMYRGADNEFSLYHGWFPSHLTKGNHIWNIRQGCAKAFPHPGIYDIALSTRSGKSTLTIKSVSLVQHGQIIASDQHEAQLKYRADKNNHYYLNLPQKNDDSPLTLRIEYQANETDNRGRFSIRPLLPEDLPSDCPLHKKLSPTKHN